jgi:pyruvate,orthophosphate dikinase
LRSTEQELRQSRQRYKTIFEGSIDAIAVYDAADEIAAEAEFFSFGTNDLTQMAMRFSRDDADKFLGEYVNKCIYAADPFQKLDQEGVGKLVEMGTKLGRKKLKVGICGFVLMGVFDCRVGIAWLRSQ